MLKSAKFEQINGISIPFYVNYTQDGTGLVMRKYPAGNKKNLKKGQRKALNRHTLTNYAKKQIKAAGRLLKWRYDNEPKFLSPSFITITYGANVPDHKTAKKHLDRFLKVIRYHIPTPPKKKKREPLQKVIIPLLPGVELIYKFKRKPRKNTNNPLYVWVAQLQTGERSRQKGLKSYRQENGAAIHFHILCEHLNEDFGKKYLLSQWKKIVNEWELQILSKNFDFCQKIQSSYGSYTAGIKQFNKLKYENKIKKLAEIGFKFEETKSEYGYDCKQVLNSANYMAKYIAYNKNEIIGNMWNMSKSMRKLVEKTKEIKNINEIDFIDFCQKHENSTQTSETKVIICEDFTGASMLFSNNVKNVIKDLEAINENRKRRNRNKNKKKLKLFKYEEIPIN